MTLAQEIQSLKTVVEELRDNMKVLTGDVMDSKTAARYLNMSKSAFDKITRPQNMLIPCSKPLGGKKVFLKKDLLGYVEKYRTE